MSPIAGGKPVYESPGYSSGSGLGPFQWTKDGTALLYSTGRTDEHPGPRLAGRPAQRFTDLTVFRFPLSPDGRSILMARGTQSRDAFISRLCCSGAISDLMRRDHAAWPAPDELR